MSQPSSLIMSGSLKEVDPEIYTLICEEENRQKTTLNLIASENYAPKAVKEATGSALTNKYSEGWPNHRYYAGNKYIDEIETLCMRRALCLFKLDQNEWGVVAQSLSGSPANFAVYTGLLEVNDVILALDLPHGGHLSHGYTSPSGKPISSVAKYFKTIAYHLDSETQLINYEEMHNLAIEHKAKIVIAGTSAYSNLIDYSKFRAASDACKGILLVDMAHIAGLIAAECIPSPFGYADIVTTTTHKTLRGPRGALIFYRKKKSPYSTVPPHPDLSTFESRIKTAIFPGLQGGPHQHVIAGIAVALHAAQAPEFRQYQQQVILNAKQLAYSLRQRNFQIVANTTETHLILVNLKSQGLSGAKFEKICEAVDITINKNTISSDVSPANPSGARLGTPALTTRGLKEKNFEEVADFLEKALELGLKIQKRSGPKLLDFIECINLEEFQTEVNQLKNKVGEFMRLFP